MPNTTLNQTDLEEVKTRYAAFQMIRAQYTMIHEAYQDFLNTLTVSYGFSKGQEVNIDIATGIITPKGPIAKNRTARRTKP